MISKEKKRQHASVQLSCNERILRTYNYLDYRSKTIKLSKIVEVLYKHQPYDTVPPHDFRILSIKYIQVYSECPNFVCHVKEKHNALAFRRSYF